MTAALYLTETVFKVVKPDSPRPTLNIELTVRSWITRVVTV